MLIPALLVDARNFYDLEAELVAEIAAAGLIGFDIETHDADRHEGLNQFMKVNDDGHKSKGKKLVFDVNRTTVTGFSWYCDGGKQAYYLNLAHADVENRIPWQDAKRLLDARQPGAHWICHNGPFELTMMRKSLGYELKNVLCTLQLAVSAFNADQYEKGKMFSAGFGELQRLLPAIAKEFVNFDQYGEMTEGQAELMSKILGKESKAEHSYNGLVNSLVYGYGLKKLTKSLFGYEQATFEETLKGHPHMGCLTGDEVVDYGADDAVWAVKIFHRILPMLPFQNEQLLETYFEQENPMIHVFADTFSEGMRLDLDQVRKRRAFEREEYAQAVVKLHKVINDMLPFPAEPNQWLLKEDWYGKSQGRTYRDKVLRWAKAPLPSSPIEIARTAAGAVSNAWSEELKLGKPVGPNFSHYMVMRTLMYDLAGIRPLYSKGKVQSDKEARDKLHKKHEHLQPMLDVLNEMAGIEQRMKLYLTPYLQLCDPDTQRIYPVLSSELNSRRMASRFPNPMQLAKRGESTYVRGFYLPDEDDHVIVSIDWSQIELVLIGDFSEDEGFAEAYGQLPFKDLHWKTVGDLMGTDDPRSLPNAKKLRTDIGKGANFNYWYSGALNTVGEKLGWSSDKMWEMTEKYREAFVQAETWRTDLIGEAREKGYITLPDGHRRTKFEATYEWQILWRERFAATGSQGLINFGKLFVQKITNRAGNQMVNSMIQGSCATLAKRSILKIRRRIQELALRARFMIPIHDELVFSVHKDDVIAFLKMAKHEMCHHPEIIRHLCVDATASIGRNFEPYHPEKAPLGQIEVDEAPLLPGFLPENTQDQKLNDEQIQAVLAYLFQEKN